MWLDAERDPDLLTFRQDDGRDGQMLGGVLSAFGLFALYGGWSQLHEPHRGAGELATGVLGLLIAAFLLLGGLYNLYCRMGLTFDRRKRQLIDWSRTPWGSSRRAQDLRQFDRVAVGRGRMRRARNPTDYPVYPLFLLGPRNARRELVNWIQTEKVARNFAATIAVHLGIEVVDLPEDTRSSPD